MLEVTHHVKVRKVGKKRWGFLTSKSGVNYLRIHAAQFTEAGAIALVEENRADNPEWEWKIVPI